MEIGRSDIFVAASADHDIAGIGHALGHLDDRRPEPAGAGVDNPVTGQPVPPGAVIQTPPPSDERRRILEAIGRTS